MSSNNRQQKSSSDKNSSVELNPSKCPTSKVSKALKAELSERAFFAIYNKPKPTKKTTTKKESKKHGSSGALEHNNKNHGKRPTKTEKYSSIDATNRFASRSASTLFGDMLHGGIVEDKKQNIKEQVGLKTGGNCNLEHSTVAPVTKSRRATIEMFCQDGKAPTSVSRHDSSSKQEKSVLPTPSKKYGETPIEKKSVGLEPVGNKIEHHFLDKMESPVIATDNATMSRHANAVNPQKNPSPTPAKKCGKTSMKKKLVGLDPVCEISKTASNIHAKSRIGVNRATPESTQHNHPTSPKMISKSSHADENSTRKESAMKAVKTMANQAKSHLKRLGPRLGFRISFGMVNVLLLYFGFIHFRNHGVDVSKGILKPHSDEENSCFSDFPQGFSPPEVHDVVQADISCREDRECPRRGRCYGGRLRDCTDGSDGKHGFALFVPNQYGNACVPSVEAIEHVNEVQGALLRLTAADACRQWGSPNYHHYPTFDLQAVVDEVNIGNRNVKLEVLPWLTPLLDSSRVIFETCLESGDEKIGVMGLGRGVLPSELPLPFSCAARFKLSDLVASLPSSTIGLFLSSAELLLSFVVTHPVISFCMTCVAFVAGVILIKHKALFEPISDGDGGKFYFCTAFIARIFKKSRSELEKLFTTISNGVRSKIAYH